MAKALRTIAVVAGAVALVATGIGAIGGATFAATALGGTIASVATWAGVVAGVAGIGATLLTKPPPARGSVTETIIEIEPPSPYLMGEGYFAGVMRHRVGYGPTLNKVPNPFLWEVLALTVAGPIEGPIVPQVDFGPVTSYYSGWLATDTRLGARPDTSLVPLLHGPAPGWGGASHLSSIAAIGWNHRFDKDGKVYASGLPTRGALAKWVKVYDPRLDSTRPGGAGPCRLGIESTYVWSESPALHAGTYAFGRYVNGKRVMGVGLPEEGIDWEGVAAWANDCDANGWRLFGAVFEGAPGDAERRWQNLRDIAIAGGGQPLFSGAVLGFHWHRPRVALDTVTEADLAEGPQEVTAMKSWRDRLNTVRPRYTSPAHNWSLVQADQVQVASYLAEDGEERAEDVPFNFVKDVNQAAQLAAYWLTNSRELSPITLTLMPRMRNYRPGECLRLQLPELGLDHDAVILRREFDPASMTVTLTLVTEDPAKHGFALGRTGVAPPTPSLTNSAADRDDITRAARAPYWPEVDGPGRPEDSATRNVARGTYNAGVTYSRGDEVIFSGSSYRLIVASSLGNPPPDVARWALVAQAGSGPAGADGLPGLTVIVSNEAHVVATAPDGTGGDYSSAGGQMRLLRGTDVLTPTFSIPARTPNTGWISIDSSGNYTVTDPGVDLATATLRANWAGLDYERIYVLGKSKAGVQGQVGPTVTLVADAQAFTFTDGLPNPAGQFITLNALLNNISGTATWSVTPAIPMGGSGNTRTISVADFGANRQVTVQATLGGITDRITLVRVDRDVSGANAVVNSDFTRGKFGWRWRGGDFENDWGVNLPGSPNWFGQRNVMWATFPATLGAGTPLDISPDALWQGGALSNAPLLAMPVVAGDRLAASVLAAPHRCTFQLYILVFDASGGLVSAPMVSGGTPGGAANGDPVNFTRLTVFADVPANGRWAIPMMRMLGTGETEPYIFFTEPMLSKVATGQTTAPRYTPGRADSTATNGAPAGTLVAGVEASALTAQAAQAATDATAANASAFAANLAISNITADNILSRDEKPEIRKQRDEIIAEYPTIRARAVALGVAVTNYDADYTALIAYLAGLSLDSATDTAITRSTFNAFFTDYYAERQTVLDGIADQASRRATVLGAEPGLRNDFISVDFDGRVQGIGPGNGSLVDNSRVPLGSNALVNSDFTRGKFGWRWEGGLFENDWGVNLPSWFGQRNVMWATVPGVWANGNVRDLYPDALWGGSTTDTAPLFAMPVVPGDRIAASVLAAQHRCLFQLWILLFDGAGSFITGNVVSGGTPGGAANGNPANFTRLSNIADISGAARWAIPMIRLVGTGESDPYIFFTEPMFSKISPGQVTVPRYSPGRADPNSDVTTAINGPAELVMQFRSDLSLISQLPVTGEYQVAAAGGGALTSGVSWSVAVLSGTFAGAAPSVVGSGGAQLRLNSEMTSPEANLRLTATFAGRSFPPFNVKCRRQIAAPSSGPLTAFDSAAFVQVHPAPIQVQIPSGVTSATLTATADLLVQNILPVGGTTVEAKWQRETSPGTWVDVGSVATSSPNPEVIETEIAPGEFVYTATPGSITCNRTATGLPGGSTQNFRLVARVSVGNVRLVRLNGNASVTA